MYYVVHDWMYTKLKFKGLKREIFAIIYGFSQNEKAGGFSGSLGYLANATGYDKTEICRNLKSLTEDNFLKKHVIYHNNLKYCRYTVNLNTIENISTPIENISTNNIVYPSNNIEREENATTLPTSNSQKESRNDYIKLIIEACSNFAITATELYHIPAFKSPQNQEILFNNLKNAKYDIEQCINKALEKTKQDLRAGKSNKPLFDFRDSLYLYLMYGGGDIDRLLSSFEIQAKLIEKHKREMAEKEREEQEAQACALEIARYSQETALLFDIEVGNVEVFSQNYEGGMIAFFDERRRREEIINTQSNKTCLKGGA